MGFDRITAVSAFLLVLILVLIASASEATGQGFDFEAVDTNGNNFRAESLQGKVLLLDFWAVWCSPCLKAFPVLSRLQNELGLSGFQVLGIAAHSGTHEDVREFLKQHPVEYPVIVGNEDLLERFGVIGFPTYFLIDPEGNIHKQYVGEVEDLYEVVVREVRSLLEKSIFDGA